MIEFRNDKHGFAIAKAARSLYNPLYDVAISRQEGGRLLGGVIYYDYTGRSISMHIAGFTPHWISRDLLWCVFHYPFVQLGCGSVFCQIRSTNKKVIKIARSAGFSVEAVIEDVFPDGDLVIHRMRKEKCKWLDLTPVTIRSNIVEAA